LAGSPFETGLAFAVARRGPNRLAGSVEHLAVDRTDLIEDLH
jgi:hypothetical protein